MLEFSKVMFAFTYKRLIYKFKTNLRLKAFYVFSFSIATCIRIRTDQYISGFQMMLLLPAWVSWHTCSWLVHLCGVEPSVILTIMISDFEQLHDLGSGSDVGGHSQRVEMACLIFMQTSS